MIGIGISINTRHQPTNRASLVVQGMKDIFGAANILTLIDASSATADINGLLQTLPATIGTTATPVSTGRARAATVLGLPAAEFYRDDVESEYNIANSAKTQLAVARLDAALPIASAARSLIHHNFVSSRLTILSGNSRWVNEAGPTYYRDGAAQVNADASPHAYAVTSATANTTVPTDLGGIRTIAAGSWIGPIWFVMQLSIEATAPQLAQAQAVLKRRFSFLP